LAPAWRATTGIASDNVGSGNYSRQRKTNRSGASLKTRTEGSLIEITSTARLRRVQSAVGRFTSPTFTREGLPT
jgi:hypothetical protein